MFNNKLKVITASVVTNVLLIGISAPKNWNQLLNFLGTPPQGVLPGKKKRRQPAKITFYTGKPPPPPPSTYHHRSKAAGQGAVSRPLFNQNFAQILLLLVLK